MMGIGTFEWLVAGRYLRARRQEGFISVITWFSLIGIALGVATLIIVMSVMNGFRQELFQRVLGLNGHINLYAMSGNLNGWEPILSKIRTVPGVRSVDPLIEGQGLLSYRGFATGVVVRGLPADVLRHRPVLGHSIVAGSMDDLSGMRVLIGRRLSDRLGVGVGDRITVLSPNALSTALGPMPRQAAFTIAAIFDVGMYEYDNGFLFTTLETAGQFLGLGASVSSLDVMVDDPYQLTAIRARLDLAARELAQPVRLLDWKQAHASFVNALQVERNVMFVILTLIILVAAFNIISGLVMLVQDKGRDIAILRTMGASRGMVLRVFLICGMAIGVIGTLSGLLLGVAFAQNIESIRQFMQSLTGRDLFSAEIYFLSRLPAVLDWREVTQVMLMALGLSFLATIYPAWRAASLDPVEALRYE